jgi:hypothetical protein
MGTKYSGVSVTGFNSSPPADDGSTVATNRIFWATIKTKLADPVKNAVESMNSAILTHVDESTRSIASDDTTAASDHLRTIQVNTSSVSVSLADAMTMANGYIVTIANQSSGDVTVGLASATDTIDGVTNVTASISTKEAKTFIVNSTAKGYITKSRTVVAATTAIPGVVELATQAEVNAMTDTSRAMTPNHNRIVLGTEQATTSGTSIDFTGIPAGVRRITINFSLVSTNGTSALLLQIGDSGGIETAGYLSGAMVSATFAESTAGFRLSTSAVAAQAFHGAVVLNLEDASDFTWTSIGALYLNGSAVYSSAGSKSLSAELDRVRLTTVNGTDTLDLGVINISYER